MKALLLLGNFTFHHFSDEELETHFGGKDQVESPDKPMCLVHELNRMIECDSEDEAGDKGEKLLNEYESYLVIPTYKGKIAFNDTYNKEIVNRAKIALEII